MGQIIDISFDDAGSVTGDPEDSFMYKVKLKNGKVPEVHFRKKDLILLEEYQRKMKKSL